MPDTAPFFSSSIKSIDVRRYYAMHFVGALFPVATGIALYGWRAAIVIVAIVATTALAIGIWRRIGPRGRQLHVMHSLWLATLLALMLPAHLATGQLRHGEPIWPLIPAAGICLAIALWTLGGIGAGRIHPVLISYLLLTILFSELLVPNRVLQRNKLVMGDLFAAGPPNAMNVSREPWMNRPIIDNDESLYSAPASETLSEYATGQPPPDRSLRTMQSLLRDQLPPLEDLIAGTHPGPIGAGSAIAVTMGGLFLVYRGLIDVRIPLLIMAAMFVSLLILPVPIVITDKPVYAWMVWRESSVQWQQAVTFVNYEMMSGPALFTAFFLATSPSIRPMSFLGRLTFSVLTGILCAVFQLYVAVSMGAYLALLLASLVTPMFDRFFRPRPIV